MPEDNDVGYKKPPKHNRFKKGQSGNPKGRPKGRKSLATRLFAILNEPVTLREGEKVRKVTKGEAMLLSLAQKAIKGDQKAFAVLMAAMRQFGEDEPASVAGLSGVLLMPGMIATEADWETLAQEHADLASRSEDEDD